MRDSLGREINYLRLSVTDRCNLRCRYCMPHEGIELTDHQEILSLEEFGRLTDIAGELGISRIRITGGEPLLRRGLRQLVEHMAANPRLRDLALTTNGIRLPELAADLKGSGIQRVNISLDTLDAGKYRYITRGGELKQVLQAVDSALECGFNPVKINTVLIKGFNDGEIHRFVEWVRNQPLHVRFIEFMPVGNLEFWAPERWLPSTDIIKELQDRYGLIPTNEVVGAGPAGVYRLPGGTGSVGFITPLSHRFCASCNRLRLTAQGVLLGCLHSREGVDLKGPLRRGADDEELKELFLQAIDKKPKGHHLQQGWGQDSIMSQIGG